ncbi:MAG TPA: O-antigen ligase family protein [Pyrinomonadaceae bacterium]|nr:O-antigen ligase family protein [Pyrinomonadaceae bacterium]
MPGVRANAGYSSITPSRARREASSARPTAIENNQPAEARSERSTLRAVKFGVPALSNGHKFSYAALFAFTLVLYVRPSELYDSPVTASMALVVGIVTLVFFLPTQLALEGNLSAPLTEVKLIVLFTMLAVVNIPLAMSPQDAWLTFSGTFIRCVVMFVVLVNVVKTETRLKGLLFLAIGTAFLLSLGAIDEYRRGLAMVEGYRVSGRGVGIFGNTNDMALFVVTILPIALAFFFGSRSKAGKIVFASLSAVMLASIVLSYSRGAFLGLIVVLIFFTIRLRQRNRLAIIAGILVVSVGVSFLVPGNYGIRLLSIFVPSLDPVQSSDLRRAELFRSIYTALRHPFFGIGMGNYMDQVSLRGYVTHNAYTEVAAEMGLGALACYTMFIVAPLRKLGQIVRETFDQRANSRLYYLTLGLQASLIAYMVSSFFLSVAYLWYVYYLVGYAVCLRRIYEAQTGKPVVVESRKIRKKRERAAVVTNSTAGVIA